MSLNELPLDTYTELEKEEVKVAPKSSLKLMKVAGALLKPFGVPFMNDFWTTYRLPFGKPVIAYPSKVKEKHLARYDRTFRHELIHVRQMKGAKLWWVYLQYAFFPLPVLFSGRWWIERPAYLMEISEGSRTIEQAVEMLWKGYLWPWPKSLMRKWFVKHLEEKDAPADSK